MSCVNIERLEEVGYVIERRSDRLDQFILRSREPGDRPGVFASDGIEDNPRWTSDERMSFTVACDVSAKKYIISLFIFGRSDELPPTYFLLDVEPTSLWLAVETVLETQPLTPVDEMIEARDDIISDGKVYTTDQVVTLIKLVRGDLNSPEGDKHIAMLLKSVQP
ncbi:hypothetical protein D9_0082 [Aeromonas phage D9]|nr:hypothetical protein D9_0082 [Aeromonas phage D9]